MHQWFTERLHDPQKIGSLQILVGKEQCMMLREQVMQQGHVESGVR